MKREVSFSLEFHFFRQPGDECDAFIYSYRSFCFSKRNEYDDSQNYPLKNNVCLLNSAY